jgi:hypothetical protein
MVAEEHDGVSPDPWTGPLELGQVVEDRARAGGPASGDDFDPTARHRYGFELHFNLSD